MRGSQALPSASPQLRHSTDLAETYKGIGSKKTWKRPKLYTKKWEASHHMTPSSVSIAHDRRRMYRNECRP